MSRFARDRRVYFIEEPIFEADAGVAPDGAVLRLDRAPTGAPPASPTNGVTVVRPVCRDPGPGGGPELDRVYARLIAELVEADDLTDPVAWFYTPMLLPGIDLLGDVKVVYDAMDELTLFRFAPDGLAGREEQLLRRAAVTFAGGASLGEAKARRHPRVRTFPSGVDADHYRLALDPLLPLPADLHSLPEPRVGYIGVIDERIDYELLREVATRRPAISWVMVGPVVKVSPDELPVVPNVAYLGQKTYAELPAYVRGFATCMMPFALNDATKFISPTKTLEYMAAHRPIVSTGVTDVVRLYGDVVRVAPDAEAFVAQVDEALAESREARAARALREQSHLARNSWEKIALGMDSELHLAFGERHRGSR
jgi:UDP-galactopyranose mutase